MKLPEQQKEVRLFKERSAHEITPIVSIFITLLLPAALSLCLGYLVNGRVQAKPQLIDVSGVISTDTTWTADNSPYIITDTVTVQAGVTLTIEAGVTVMFEAGSGQHMAVEGHLEVAGTAVNPVLITSKDDLPTDRWIGINVTSGSANFAHTTFGGGMLRVPLELARAWGMRCWAMCFLSPG